jgi:hypothetical protein
MNSILYICNSIRYVVALELLELLEKAIGQRIVDKASRCPHCREHAPVFGFVKKRSKWRDDVSSVNQGSVNSQSLFKLSIIFLFIKVKVMRMVFDHPLDQYCSDLGPMSVMTRLPQGVAAGQHGREDLW